MGFSPARSGRGRWLLLAIVLVSAGVIAWLNRGDLIRAAGLALRVRPLWLLLAAAAIATVYLLRAEVYDVTLGLMGHSLGHRFLWRSAVIATSLHQLIPVGGASGYAFLTYAFHGRGVTAGEASVAALLDTVSNASAVALVVLVSLPYLGLQGRLVAGELAAILGPGVLVIPLAVGLYWLQARRERMTGVLLGVKRRLQRLLPRRLPDGPLLDFVDQYFAGKAVIARRPLTFATLIGLQMTALVLDCAALYAVFVGLGEHPRVLVVAMGFVVALAGLTLIAVPGGGGSAEVIMSAFFATNGIEPDRAIAAVLLYRLVSFWLPVLYSMAALWRWRASRSRASGPSRG